MIDTERLPIVPRRTAEGGPHLSDSMEDILGREPPEYAGLARHIAARYGTPFEY